MTNIGLIFVTTRNLEEAKTIAKSLLESRLAACVNILPSITSIYHWEGTINESQETLLLIKALETNYPEIEKQIKLLHSYQNPEVIFIPITKGSKEYLDWISKF